MAAAGEPTTAGKRKNRAVVWAGGGGGGLLLLGGALAATAALGVAFIVRAAIKKKTEKAKGSLQEAEGEKKGGDTTCSSEGRAEEGEERGGLPSLLPPPPPPPPPQASPQPPPPPKEEENSNLKREQTLTGENPSAVSEESGADGSSAKVGEAATVQKSDFVRVEEKIIKESSLIRGGHGEGVEDVLPAIVNKDVVVDESKIIQVVGGEAPLEETAPADGSARVGEEEEEEGPPVEEGAEKSSGATGDPSMAEAEAPQVVRPAKAMEPSLPSVEVIQNPKPVVMMTIKEEVFLGTGQKLGVEVAEAPWKANRMVAEMREKGVMDRMVVEMREKRFSRNAQVVILVSTVFCTTLLAILLHHYGSRLLESTLV